MVVIQELFLRLIQSKLFDSIVCSVISSLFTFFIIFNFKWKFAENGFSLRYDVYKEFLKLYCEFNNFKAGEKYENYIAKNQEYMLKFYIIFDNIKLVGSSKVKKFLKQRTVAAPSGMQPYIKDNLLEEFAILMCRELKLLGWIDYLQYKCKIWLSN